MCGISGAIPLGDVPNEKLFAIITHLLDGNLYRGREATGIATFDLKADEITILKAATDATEFNRHITSENIKGPVIAHNRMPTKGSPENPNNNHPMFSAEWVLVHNGVVTIPDSKDYTYKGECDTERLLALIQQNGIEEAIPKIEGSATFAAFNARTREFYLYKHDNPVNVIWVPDKIFAFSSLETPLKKVPEIVGDQRLFGLFSSARMAEFDEGTLFRINLDTKEMVSKKIDIPKKAITTSYCGYNRK